MSSQGKVFESYWCAGQGWNSFPFKEVWDTRWKTLKSYKVDLVLSRVQHSPLIGWFPEAKIHISLQTTTWERTEGRTWILEGMGPGKDIHPWEESIESVQPDSKSLMFLLASFIPSTCSSCTAGKLRKCIAQFTGNQVLQEEKLTLPGRFLQQNGNNNSHLLDLSHT